MGVPLVLLVDETGAELDEAGHLGLQMLRVEVEVVAVLRRLPLGHLDEQQGRSVGRSVGTTDHRDLGRWIRGHVPAERSGPERGLGGGVVRIERDCADGEGHGCDRSQPRRVLLRLTGYRPTI